MKLNPDYSRVCEVNWNYYNDAKIGEHTNMSKLIDKIFLMRDMNNKELKKYIKTLTDNEKI
nr:MAG TPA: hypothetical protein [Caudoviricetes sp.]